MLPIITDRKLRIAVIGCGRISANHFAAIAQHAEDFELVAVCDNQPEVLQEHAARHGVPGYARMEDLLRETTPDLVALCTPSGMHPDQAVLAAAHGSNVITEKPMATRWADGQRMVRACDTAGVRLFVVKQNRRNPTLQLLKRALDEKRFGRVFLANINVFWTRPQSYYDSARWRGTWELDGGALMNQASHYVDLLTWLIGPVESVQAMAATLGRDIQVEDTAVMNVRWRSGALGSMSVTMLTYPKNLEGSITVLGERDSVRIGGVAVNEVQEWRFEDERDYDAQVRDASYQTTSVYGFGHPLYYANVVDVMRGRRAPETDGREGLSSLEILIAAYRSSREGRTIPLPLEF